METLQNQKISKNIAFVLGNGISRLVVDPNSFGKEGVVYGCNAQYRTFTLDYLVAVDVKMVNEIIESEYHKTNQVWTNPNKGIKSREYLNFFNPHKGWSSGPTALWLASIHNYEEIYICGFDFKGINGRVNNIFAGTKNYKKQEDTATFYGNWLNQTQKVIQQFTHIKYFRVIQEGNFIPNQLTVLPNCTHINYDELITKYQKIRQNS